MQIIRFQLPQNSVLCQLLCSYPVRHILHALILITVIQRHLNTVSLLEFLLRIISVHSLVTWIIKIK